MATQVSVPYHRWSARCVRVMSLAEDILAAAGMAQASAPADLERLETETRILTAESQQVENGLDRSELKKISRDALQAAERLREVIERTPLPDNHPLRNASEGFADHAELLALTDSGGSGRSHRPGATRRVDSLGAPARGNPVSFPVVFSTAAARDYRTLIARSGKG